MNENSSYLRKLWALESTPGHPTRYFSDFEKRVVFQIRIKSRSVKSWVF